MLSEQLNKSLGSRGQIKRLMKLAWRAQLRAQVRDPQLRARLKPDYPLGCKRLLFSNDWYTTLTQPNVELVTEPVVEVLPEGVRSADGTLHEVDVIIYGTGFAATEFLAPMQITGVAGADLHARWKEGARAYLGLCVPDFPNLFVVYGPNTNLGGSSVINMLEAASGAITTLLQHAEQTRRPRRRRPRGRRGTLRPRDPGAARAERLGRLLQLVPRGRRPDHHQLAGPGRGVPAPLRRARPAPLRDRVGPQLPRERSGCSLACAIAARAAFMPAAPCTPPPGCAEAEPR